MLKRLCDHIGPMVYACNQQLQTPTKKNIKTNRLFEQFFMTSEKLSRFKQFETVTESAQQAVPMMPPRWDEIDL